VGGLIVCVLIAISPPTIEWLINTLVLAPV